MGKMVFEQMLTILLGTAAGVAVVLYTVEPRRSVISDASIVTISLPYVSGSDSLGFSTSTPAITAPQPQAEEAPMEIHTISPGSLSTVSAEAATGSGELALASVGAPSASLSAQTAARRAPSARSHRAPRRSSTLPSRAAGRPRAPASGRAATRKRLPTAP